MPDFLFQNVKITDSKSSWNGKSADVWISEGRISRIAKGGTMKKNPGMKSAEGGVLSPGWVDSRVHLTDPGAEWKDDIHSLAKAAVKGGFTRLVCLPNTSPAIDTRDSVQAFYSRAAGQPVHMHVTGCLSTGAEGKDMAELFDMFKAGAVAFGDGSRPVQDAGMLLRGLQYLKPFEALLMNFPQDKSLAGTAQVAESPVSVRLGLKGIPAMAEEMMVARDLKLLEYFEGKLHLAPVTTAGSADLIRKAKKRFEGLSAGTTIAHLAYHDEMLLGFDPNWKLKPPLRPKEEMRALRRALQDGTLDLIASGHHPQAQEDKLTDFSQASPGMIALETCVPLALTSLAETLEPAALLDCFSYHPRRIFSLEPVSIDEGMPAELSHFEWADWKFGENDIRSKSRNTPFLGTEFKIRVRGIYCKSRYQEA